MAQNKIQFPKPQELRNSSRKTYPRQYLDRKHNSNRLGTPRPEMKPTASPDSLSSMGAAQFSSLAQPTPLTIGIFFSIMSSPPKQLGHANGSSLLPARCGMSCPNVGS